MLTGIVDIPLVRISVRDTSGIEHYTAVDANVVIIESWHIERATVNVCLGWHGCVVSVEYVVEGGKGGIVALDAVQVRCGIPLTVVTYSPRSNCNIMQVGNSIYFQSIR